MRDLLRTLAAPAVCALACVLAGCGASGGGGAFPNADATLILDFTPNAVHAGIYSALARGYDAGEGVHLHVRAPSASTDSVKLLLSGRADFAILDIHDLAIARAQGRDIVGLMAIVEQPLAAVIAQPGIASPRQLAGRRVGVTGLPSDDAVLRSVVAGAHGDPRRVREVTIGFNAVPALLARRVAGVTAFWNAEGVALQRRRAGVRIFKVADFGAPSYPELVLCATRATLRDNRDVAGAVVRAIVRGEQFALTDPQSSESDLETRVPGLDHALTSAELDAVDSAFQAPDGRVGELDPSVLRAWAVWEARFGIVKRPPDVARMFDFKLAPH